MRHKKEPIGSVSALSILKAISGSCGLSLGIKVGGVSPKRTEDGFRGKIRRGGKGLVLTLLLCVNSSTDDSRVVISGYSENAQIGLDR